MKNLQRLSLTQITVRVLFILLIITTVPGYTQDNYSGSLEFSKAVTHQDAPTLYFHLQQNPYHITIKAELNEVVKEITVWEQNQLITQGFKYLYNVLKCNQAEIDAEFNDKLDYLSKELLTPFTDLINQSGRVMFIIDPKLIKYPLDLMKVNGDYLFLQKPVLYGFHKIIYQNTSAYLTQDSKGLIIRDKTADPENGCGFVKNIYQKSSFYNANRINLTKLSKPNHYDFILISAHGMVSLDETDYIQINHERERLLPDFCNQFHPRLIYLGSCQLGTSYPFILNAASSGAEFYLAPIVSNEAGYSSAETKLLFFRGLFEGKSVVDSLFETRGKLYNQFSKRELNKLLWYSYPFRVYLLNLN